MDIGQEDFKREDKKQIYKNVVGGGILFKVFSP